MMECLPRSFMHCYGLHFYLGLGNRNLAYIELPWDKKKLMTHLLLLLLRSYSTLVQTVLLNLRITWYTCWGGEGDHEGPAIGMPTKSNLNSSLLTLRTQHVDPAWSRTQTSRPGLFHWPWGQCHRQHIQFTFILLRWSVMDWFLSVSKQFASQIECDRNLAFGDAAKLKLEASVHVFYHSWHGP